MRRIRFLAVSALAAAGLAACATPGPDLDAAGLREPVEIDVKRPGSLYALYLGGQSALLSGRSEDAAAYFHRAAEAAPDDPVLRERAFVSALLAGDVSRASELAPAADAGSPTTQRLGGLVRAVEHLAEGDAKLAAAELSGDAVGYPHRAAAALVRPWALAAAGDAVGSTAVPEAGRDRVVQVFGLQNRAQLLERARRHEEAEADWRTLLTTAPGNDLFVLGYGAFLERRGRRTEAAALYQAEIATDPYDNELAAALTRATARRSAAPSLPTPTQGAAAALLAPAASLVAERQGELGLAYLRLALRLDPKLDEAWLLVGDQLNEGKDRDGARAAYGQVRPTADEYATAQARLSWTWQQDGNTEEALRLSRKAAEADPDDRTLQLAYADILRAGERFDESAAVLSGVIDREVAVKPDWRVLYMRGIALEQAGRWPDAERDLVRALELNPNEPELLNYLGYAWVDRGERLEQAFSMLEKAVSLNTRSGAIIDSLGWAHYRLGRFDKALEQLERAVELEPADATINDHLGDAYWRVGRRTEAQFQWRRALTLEPDAKLKAAVDAKLASGLGPTGPAPASTTVAQP